MDEQWLQEWSTGEAEYPPKTLREDVGALLAEVAALRAVAKAARPVAGYHYSAERHSPLIQALAALDALPPVDAAPAPPQGEDVDLCPNCGGLGWYADGSGPDMDEPECPCVGGADRATVAFAAAHGVAVEDLDREADAHGIAAVRAALDALPPAGSA